MQLINQVQGCNNLSELVDHLSKRKIDMIQADIKTNQHSFWRRIKPVHWIGHSRFQTTLDRALSLSASLTPKKTDAKLIDALTEEYKHTVKEPEQISLFSERKSYDFFKTQIKSVHYTDKSNAAVIEASLDSALNHWLQNGV